MTYVVEKAGKNWRLTHEIGSLAPVVLGSYPSKAGALLTARLLAGRNDRVKIATGCKEART